MTIDILCGIIFGIVPAVLGSIFLLITKENDAVSDPVADAIQKELEELVLSRCKPCDPDTLLSDGPSELTDKQFKYLNERSKTKRSGNCPNCGAPVSGGQCCEYCGTYYSESFPLADKLVEARLPYTSCWFQSYPASVISNDTNSNPFGVTHAFY